MPFILFDFPLSQFLHPRHWPTWILVGLTWLLSWLPLPVVHALGSGAGELLFHLLVSRRRVAVRNVKRCFPELDADEHTRIARRHFHELGKASLSIGFNWWAGAGRFSRVVVCRDRHHFDQAVAAGRNIILLAPHFVALEIGGYYLSRELPMTTMYQKTRNPLLDAMIQNRRSRFGGILIERRTDLRTLVKSIRSGRPFYYLPDQDPGFKGGGVFVPFFGIQTATFPMLHRFARLGSAVVLPCFTRQLPWGRGYEIIFLPPLKDFPGVDDIDDTRHMNEIIEQGVRMMPEQYFWVHKRFKTRPEGEGDFYA